MSFSELVEAFHGALAPPHCPGCDFLSTSTTGFCAACEPLLEESRDPRFAYEYGGPIADAIIALKFARRRDYIPTLSSMLVQRARVFAGTVDIVTNVPLHWSRKLQRGFDQSALLARPVAPVLGVQHAPELLRRLRPTLSQSSSRSKTERIANLRGAFDAKRTCEGKRILLIDDVWTTGATMASAQNSLLSAGAEQVICLALAGVV